MKKIYFLSLLCCLSFAAFAQTTITIYATGAAGSYITGSASVTPTRTDGNIVSTGATSRGYAVFDLSSLPASATVTSCVIGFNVSAYGGGGGASGWNTYGYAGDLSTVSTPATLFSDMVAGTSLSTATYGGFPGNKTLASTAASTLFMQSNAGNKVSICWTGGGTCIYTITGETGTVGTTGGHVPYLQITYTCGGVSGVSASAAPNPLCVGALLTLTGSGTGTTSYSWAGPGGYSSTLQNPTFTTSATSGGVYTLTAYNAGGCGTKATTASVTFKPTPVATVTPTGPIAICTGGTVVLTTSTGAGYTYQWSNSSSAIAGETNNSYVASNNGDYTVDITDPTSGCVATSSSTVVTVLPLSPSLIPAGTGGVCVGSDLTLSVNLTGSTGGIGYQWENGGVALPGATNSTYTTATGGVFTCLLSATGCSVLTTATTVSVLPLPTPTITYTGGQLKTSSLYTNFQWYLNLVSIAGANSYSLTPPNNGSYRVKVTDINGCSNYSSQYLLYILAVDQPTKADVKIYPNPTSKMLHIESGVNLRSVITDLAGKTILDNTNAKDIDVSELANGIYMIVLYNEAGERVSIDKLVKE